MEPFSRSLVVDDRVDVDDDAVVAIAQTEQFSHGKNHSHHSHDDPQHRQSNSKCKLVYQLCNLTFSQAKSFMFSFFFRSSICCRSWSSSAVCLCAMCNDRRDVSVDQLFK